MNIINSPTLTQIDAVNDQITTELNLSQIEIKPNALEDEGKNFTDLLTQGIDALNNNLNAVKSKVAEISKSPTSLVINPEKMLEIQEAASRHFTGITIASKLLNSSVKSINELTHIQ